MEYAIVCSHEPLSFFFDSLCNKNVNLTRCDQEWGLDENIMRRNNIWRFPRIGGTPKPSKFNGVFHYKPSMWGYPHWWQATWWPGPHCSGGGAQYLGGRSWEHGERQGAERRAEMKIKKGINTINKQTHKPINAWMIQLMSESIHEWVN